MSEKNLQFLIVLGTVFVSLVLFSWWFFFDPVKGFVENVPGMDNAPETLSGGSDFVAIGELFESFDSEPATSGGAWPRFRGAFFDNISRERIALAERWDSDGPPVLWSVDLGEGHAGPVVHRGRVYLLDYDEASRADVLRCFSFEDGRELWRRGYELFIKRNHGMSRTVPAVLDDYVVTIGPKCHVMCVEADSGVFRWGLDLASEFEAEVPLWYTGQCPLLEDGKAIFAVGGSALLIAVDLETGELIWRTPNANNWKMSHSSVMPVTIDGQQMYVYCAIGGVLGVAPLTGDVLFETTLWNPNVIAPSPIHLGGGRLLLCAGYGAGSMVVQVRREDGVFSVDSLQTIPPDAGLASEQQTPIVYNGFVYSILPKDAGPKRNEFVCADPENLKRLVWTSGTTNRFGLGPYIVADDKFYILSDDGVLTMIRASADGYEQLARSKLLDGHDAWGPLAIVEGKMLARDSRRMVCVDLRD